MAYVNFKLDIDADGIALVTWDAPGRSMNVIDLESLDEGTIDQRCVWRRYALGASPKTALVRQIDSADDVHKDTAVVFARTIYTATQRVQDQQLNALPDYLRNLFVGKLRYELGDAPVVRIVGKLRLIGMVFSIWSGLGHG